MDASVFVKMKLLCGVRVWGTLMSTSTSEHDSSSAVEIEIDFNPHFNNTYSKKTSNFLVF